ncbi:MAG: FAD-dependent oxidoreductase, partial [Pseudomonadota bacterium]
VDGWVFNGHTPNSLFCDRRNLFKPAFYRFLLEIARFNKVAKARLAETAPISTELTVGDLLREGGFSDDLARKYLLPMGAAIWSSSLADVRDYPLPFFLQFFENHGLLDLTNRPQWFTLVGGSSSYIPHFTDTISGDIRVATGVARVARTADGVRLVTETGQTADYDRVVLACHSDQALGLLDAPNEAEQRVLESIPYRENRVILHRDEAALPATRLGRASWNYRLGADETTPPSVTYSMNILQCLPEGAPQFCVTLNPNHAIREESVLGEYSYAHPQFGVDMMAAQAQRGDICGVDRIHYCGAYWYSGFHEDGVRSALDVCEQLGCPA